MTIGPEPMIRMRLRSVRLGRLFLHEPVDDRGLRRRLFSAVKDIVEPAVADPRDLTATPELLAQDAHAPIDPLTDCVGFERGFGLRRERGPLGFLAAPFGLPIRDQVLGHGEISLPSGSSDRRSDRTGNWRRAGPARPPDGTARRRPAILGAAALRRCRR